MKIVLKILLFPITFSLTVFIWIFSLALKLSAFALGFAGTVLGVLGLSVLILDSVKRGIILLVISFLISPVGIPMLIARLLGVLQSFKYFLTDTVCG